MSEELKRLQTFIPAETLRDVKIVAAERGWNIAETVAMLLREGINDYVREKNDQ